MPLEFLDTEHPIYTANKEQWVTEERRLRGGVEVLSELRKFDWEKDSGEHQKLRKNQATYLNFPDMFTRMIVGHLMREAPQADEGLSFGGLGLVQRAENVREPSRAELVYYNADGAGNDGSQWNPFWADQLRRAAATGHRWIMVEATRSRPETFADEKMGSRPYLVGMSPLAVTNWDYEEGQLNFAILRFPYRRISIKDGKMEGNDPVKGYMLLVRAQYDALGDAYAAGGWWLFDEDKEPLQGPGNEPLEGTWEMTGGQVPIFPLYWERDEGSEDLPAMSRSGTHDLGQIAVSFMNQSSAADFDAWDAAQSTTYLLGIGLESWNLMVEKEKAGNKKLPVPADKLGNIPAVYDGSQGAVVAGIFDTLLIRKREEAKELAAREATGVPDSSGVSKEAGFADAKEPILTRLAREIEQAQNTALFFLESRFGIPQPTGSVTWPQQFSLIEVMEDIERFFNLEKTTGYKSPTLGAKLMVQAAKERNLMPDDEEAATIQAEYENAATTAQEQAEAQASAFAGLGLDAGGAV